MAKLARFVVGHRRLVLVVWLLLAVAGAVAAPRAVNALSYDFGLPGKPGAEANQRIASTLGTGGNNAPLLLAVEKSAGLRPDDGQRLAARVAQALPGSRIASFAETESLLAPDRRVGAVLVYPRPLPGGAPYARAIPALQQVANTEGATLDAHITVTGADVLATGGSSSGGADVLAETLFGGVGALIVLVVVFGSFLALTPLLVAAASILTTFLLVWGLTAITDVSFIVQFLLALIGLGVAIDYALLVVTRWREERGRGATEAEAVERSLATAGRSVLFSGVTVAVSLAALIVLPVPFLRSIGFTGLLIPLVSVAAALTLLPALLLTVGRRLDWPHRRTTDPTSRLWQRIGRLVVRRRWVSAGVAVVVLVALALPLTGLTLGQPSNSSLVSRGGPAADALQTLERAGLGSGITQPVEIVTDSPRRAFDSLEGVVGTAAPPSWSAGDVRVVDAWTASDPGDRTGAHEAADIRAAARRGGAQVGGISAQNADFISAIYGNAWEVALLIVLVTFALLAFALRAVVLPLKALLLNVLSLAAAYGVTVLLWQDGVGTRLLFSQDAAGSITVWVPVAVFAFLFGLSMDYEVFLLSRIKEEYQHRLLLGDDVYAATDEATVFGLARTGRLVTSAALILFLAFVALSRIPTTDVKILATGLALGIVLDATIVRGVLAPALVAALGPANWWWPTRRR